MRTASLIFALCALVASPGQLRADEPRTMQESVIHHRADGTTVELDVYAPADAENLPVVIYLHGGGWRFGDKRNVELKPAAFNKRGYVLISINYRLQPGVTYRDQAADVAAAIAVVHKHAAQFHAAADQIFLMGHSAGAHLAALVATDGRYLEAAGLEPSDLRGVILIDGAAYDIPRQIQLAPLPRMRQIYHDAFGDDEAVQRDASPITHVAPDRGIPPFLILYVASRRDGRLQSIALAKRLRECGVTATLFAAENKTHATINRELGQPDDPPTGAVFEFLKSQRIHDDE